MAPWDRERFIQLILFALLTPNLTLPEPAFIKVRTTRRAQPLGGGLRGWRTEPALML